MTDDLERAPTAAAIAPPDAATHIVAPSTAAAETDSVWPPPTKAATQRYREPPQDDSNDHGRPDATERAPDPSRSATEAIAVPTAEPGDSRLLADRDGQLRRQEHLATVGRVRRLLPLAIALWVGFFFVDFVLATWVQPGPLWPYLVLRLLGVLPIAGVLLLLRRPTPPSPGRLAAYDLVMTSSCASILAGMCLLSGGLTSPFATYIAMVIAGRAAAWPNHWRVGVLRLGVAAAASPLVMLVALPFSAALRAQLSDPRAVATYFFFLMLIFGAWVLLVIGSHNAWTLRRQVFATRSIGRYRLLRRIGHGGMGEVWTAWHEPLQRNVALKILTPDSGTDPRSVERFEREIVATAALSHPNTVRIFDHGVTDDGLWYYAMELLAGEDMHQLITRCGALDPQRAVSLVRQAAAAIGEAHRHQIIHRDLKPENLFIADLGGEKDFVKVLDFGIARVTDRSETRLTSTGWVTGTPAYLSPEGASGHEVEAPADVYALGAVLYFAITGGPPFSATNSMQLLQLHVNGEVELPSQRLGKQLPADLQRVVMRCLAKAPQDRYADADALVLALDALHMG